MNTTLSEKARAWAPVVLRLGLVILFLWFGLSQVTDPAGWTSWVPGWAHSLPVPATTLVLLNGGFETVLGVALLLGYWTRIVAGLLTLHLLFIAYEVGYNDIGVRDFCLAIATAAVALYGGDRYSLDARQKSITEISNTSL
jgi:uncharacterized membrane protein YphA (DoxX/SURF4 family)